MTSVMGRFQPTGEERRKEVGGRGEGTPGPGPKATKEKKSLDDHERDQ